MVQKMRMMMVILLAALTAGCNANTLIVAHRGASGCAPENTLASVKHAWMVDSDAVEIDVHLTKDGKVVVIHDGNAKRTSGEDLIIKDTVSEDLRCLDVGSFVAYKFRNEKIPFLEEVLATIPDGKKIFIEVKCADERIIPCLKQLINNSGKRKNVVIISFNLDLITKAKRLMPDIPVYWLVGARFDKEKQDYLLYEPSLIEKVKEAGIDGLDLGYIALTKDYVDQIHKEGLKVYVWTVNYLDVMKRMQELGVDGITTNHPADARIYLNSLN